jgi:hypothetical protein
MANIVTYEKIKNQKYDYVIVGTGIAAFSLIQNLKYEKILCIEAGDLADAAPSKYISNQIGHINDWNEHSILGFGGTSKLWKKNLLVAPLIKSETLNWPIEKSEFDLINSYACKWLKLDPVFFNNLVNSDENKFTSRPLISKYFPNNFFSVETLPSNIDILVNSRVMELKGDPVTNKIIIYSEKKKNNHEIIIEKPCKVILATGGFENARILLSSKSSKSYNHSTIAGKFLMEHLTVYCGHIFVKKEFFKRFSSEIGNNERYKISAGINIKLSKNENLHVILIFIKKKFKDIKNINNLDDRLKKFILKNNEYQIYSVIAMGETLTSEINKIQLLSRKQKINPSFMDIFYIFSPKEFFSIYKSIDILLNELIDQNIGFGHFDNDLFSKATGGGHVMGTTKMSYSSYDGIVDENLKHHKIENLFITGSSVFPTSGAVNPTFTIVGLSIRLAKYLNNLRK